MLVYFHGSLHLILTIVYVLINESLAGAMMRHVHMSGGMLIHELSVICNNSQHLTVDMDIADQKFYAFTAHTPCSSIDVRDIVFCLPVLLPTAGAARAGCGEHAEYDRISGLQPSLHVRLCEIQLSVVSFADKKTRPAL